MYSCAQACHGPSKPSSPRPIGMPTRSETPSPSPVIPSCLEAASSTSQARFTRERPMYLFAREPLGRSRPSWQIRCPWRWTTLGLPWRYQATPCLLARRVLKLRASPTLESLTSLCARERRRPTSRAELLAGDIGIQGNFGNAVALNGDEAVIGAPWQSGPGRRLRSGEVYLFSRSGTTWTQTASLQASDGATDDHLGDSVAFSGNVLIAGDTRGRSPWLQTRCGCGLSLYTIRHDLDSDRQADSPRRSTR